MSEALTMIDELYNNVNWIWFWPKTSPHYAVNFVYLFLLFVLLLLLTVLRKAIYANWLHVFYYIFYGAQTASLKHFKQAIEATSISIFFCQFKFLCEGTFAIYPMRKNEVCGIVVNTISVWNRLGHLNTLWKFNVRLLCVCINYYITINAEKRMWNKRKK